MYVRAHIVVGGVVQGVGYRYFVVRQARQMNLNGWVKNLPGGEVEIDVEGPRSLIESLIQELRVGNPWATVRNMDVRWDTYSGKFTGFDIAF